MFQKIAKHRANDASNDVHRPPLPVGGSVGGCGAQAVSRKTPIYFINSIIKGAFCNCSSPEMLKVFDS